MKPGEQFEISCYNHLKKHYKTERTDFYRHGGMDSTKSDIAVIKDNKIRFYIEVKDALAQSGQFVLLPNETAGLFEFSNKNHSEPNEMTAAIIEYMNQNFYYFNHAGTAGKELDIDSCIFADWIINHYRRKGVKYIISYYDGYVIFPIRKFADYFDITAKYRIKKSGSSSPAKKDIPAVTEKIRAYYPTARFYRDGKKVFVRLSEPLTEDRFILGDYTYYLSAQDNGCFEVRRLSNTYHMNVIFSIRLIKHQSRKDLEEFKAEL